MTDHRQPDAPAHPSGPAAGPTLWTRRRQAMLSSALRGAAYSVGAGSVGLLFWWLQQRLFR
ncbi:hypothetical protein [Micromonospora sp. NPDC023737]|uniref:hypothetical protein n=1 Tax=unclassified Micromonospora TaxID=2617518 RepID=UPI0033D6AE88